MKGLCWRIVLSVLPLAAGWAWAGLEEAVRPVPLTSAQRAKLQDAQRLHQEALKLAQQGKVAESIAAAEKKLALEREVWGKAHFNLVNTLDLLAWLQEVSEDFAAARKARQELLAIKIQRLGARHWQVTDARLALAYTERLAVLSKEQRRRLAAAEGLNQQMLRLYNQGKYDAALLLAQQVTDIHKQVLGKTHPSYAASLGTLAILYKEVGAYDRAEPLLKEALQVRKQVLGEQHPTYATNLNNLALVYKKMGDYARAEPLYREALQVRKQVLGDRHPDYTQSLDNLALLYQARGAYAQAEPLFREALQVRKQALGDQHPTYADSLNNLAGLYQARGAHAQAEPLFREALRLRKQVFGDQHPLYANSLNNLAGLYQDMGAYARALPLVQEARRLFKQVLGDRHPAYARSLSNLAGLYQAMGAYAQAEPLYQEALQVHRQVLGDRHPACAASLDNLALLYKDMGAHDKALPLALEALKRYRLVLGDRDPAYIHSLNNLALLYQAMGAYHKALPLYQQGLRLTKQVLGEQHPNYAASLTNLAGLYKDLGDYGKALPLFQEARRLFKRVLGDQHPHYPTSLNSLALLYQAMGANAQAEPLYKQALKLRRQVLGDRHPDYATSLNSLALLYKDMGAYARAEPLFQEALKLRRQVLGDKHPDYATSLNSLALLYEDMGAYHKALPLLQAARRLFRQVLGDQHPYYAASLTNLAALYRVMGAYAEAEPLFLEARRLLRQGRGDKHPDYAASLTHLAGLYKDMGAYARAEPLYQEARQLFKQVLGEQHLHYGASLNNLAGLYQDMGDYSRAEPLFQEALKRCKQGLGDQHPDYATSLDNLAGLYASLQRWQEALQATDQAARCLRRHVSRVLPALSEPEQFSFLHNKYEGAFHSSLSLGLRRRTDPDAVALSAGWLLNGKAVAQQALAQRILLTRDLPDPALAGTVQELLAVRKHLTRLALQVPPARQADVYLQNLARLDTREQELAKRLGRASSHALVGDPWVELAAVRRALPPGAVLIDLVRFHVFDFRARGTERRWQPARYAAWIVPPPGQGPVRLIDLGLAGPIDGAVAAVRQALQAAPQAITDAGERQAEQVLGRRLQDLAWRVLQPLLPHIGQSPRWLLSPDGTLWLVPWAALPLPDGCYALEKHQISYLVSGRDLVPTGPRPSRKDLVLMADPDFELGWAKARAQTQEGRRRPSAHSLDLATLHWPRLPGTAAEARAVAPLLARYGNAEPQVYTGKHALKSVFQALHRPRVLMLSTHGFFLEDQDDAEAPLSPGRFDRSLRLVASRPPLRPKTRPRARPIENPLVRCGLVLAGANQRGPRSTAAGNEGLLTGLEIVGTDLRGTDLVVLSACDTGLGVIHNGEGVASLRQAFHLAGARTVLATLWKIPDAETAQLMTGYFANLAAGWSKADALRRAQLALMRARRVRHGAAHPLFWAAFSLTGDPGSGRAENDPVVKPPAASLPVASQLRSFWLLLGGTLGLLVALGSWQRQKRTCRSCSAGG